MKKNVLILLCLLSCMTLFAQSPGKLFSSPISGSDNIIRYDPTTGYHITYSYGPSRENHFSFTNYSMQRDVKVADNLIVKDFEIIDDYVFFCGDDGANSGILSWFRISEFLSGPGPTFIDPTLNVGSMATLDNIEVFKDISGIYHVVGYGYDITLGLVYPNYRAFEAVGDPAAVMKYRTMRMDNNEFGSRIVDMAVTDNFVTYLGSCINQGDNLRTPFGLGYSFHTFPKNDMFGNPPYHTEFFQTVGFVPDMVGEFDPNASEPSDQSHPRIVHSKFDEIAVSSYRDDLLSRLPVNSYLANRTFDLSPLLSSGCITMLSVDFADLNTAINGDIDGFLYDPDVNRYVVLHHYQVSGTRVFQYYVTTLDYSSGVPIQVEYEEQVAYGTPGVWKPTSICLDPLNKYSVCGYDSGMSGFYYFWQNDVVRTPGGCTVLSDDVMHRKPCEIEKVREYDETPTSWINFNFAPFAPGRMIQQHVNVICE